MTNGFFFAGGSLRFLFEKGMMSEGAKSRTRDIAEIADCANAIGEMFAVAWPVVERPAPSLGPASVEY